MTVASTYSHKMLATAIIIFVICSGLYSLRAPLMNNPVQRQMTRKPKIQNNFIRKVKISQAVRLELKFKKGENDEPRWLFPKVREWVSLMKNIQEDKNETEIGNYMEEDLGSNKEKLSSYGVGRIMACLWRYLRKI